MSSTGLTTSPRAATGPDIYTHRVLIFRELRVIPAHTNFAEFSPTYLAVFLLVLTACAGYAT